MASGTLDRWLTKKRVGVVSDNQTPDHQSGEMCSVSLETVTQRPDGDPPVRCLDDQAGRVAEGHPEASASVATLRNVSSELMACRTGVPEGGHTLAHTSTGRTIFSCVNCSKTYNSKGSLSLHCRKMHPLEYHRDNAPPPLKKARWEREELVLMARREVALESSGVRSINFALRDSMPGRSLEAIKGQRRSLDYRALVAEIREDTSSVRLSLREEATDGLPPLPSSCPVVEDGRVVDAPVSLSEEADGSSLPPSWSSHPLVADGIITEPEVLSPSFTLQFDPLLQPLLDAVKESRPSYHFNDREFSQLLSICGSAVSHQERGELQALIDREYALWFKAMMADHHQTHCEIANKTTKTRKKRDGNPKTVGPVSRHPSRDTRNTRVKRQSPSTVKRARTYARVQRAWDTDRTRCGKNVLSGTWSEEPTVLPLPQQEEYWGGLFGQESVKDDRAWSPISSPVAALCAPFTLPELDRAIGGQGNGSPGEDGVRKSDCVRVGSVQLTARCNLWMLAACPPSAFRSGYTVLPPKVSAPTLAAEHRPITIGSMFGRIFHRALSARFETELPLGVRQKAFRRGDGLRDNVWVLRSLLRDKTRRIKPLSIAFVDVAKAFDSVSHDSLLLAARRIGVPDRLVAYIGSLYQGSCTKLKVGRRLGAPLPVRQGVRQGDPLSGLLFNFVMDAVLAKLDPKLGVRLSPTLIFNHLAFADDVALIAETAEGLRILAKTFESELALVGLKPNPKKSATLQILTDGKRKKWVCGGESILTLNQIPVAPVTIQDAYRYLGTYTTLGSKQPLVETKLTSGLANLRKAPLKPQQKLFVLRTQLIPSLHHELVLGDRITSGLLKRLDRIIRKSVREWLRLPHDTPCALFYSRAAAGGLELGELSVQIPLQRRDRLDKLIESASSDADPILQWFANNCNVIPRARHRWCSIKSRRVEVDDVEQWRTASEEELHRSVDGIGLSHHGDVPGIHRWVTNGSRVMSGAGFIGAIQLASGVLSTRLRAARGNPDASTLCDCCGRVESLGHILQVCERTHRGRNDRHNRVVDLVSSKLESRGFTVVHEPRIRTGGGIRKPDIVAYKPGDTAVVIDVTIVSDAAELDQEHGHKVRYYDVPEVRSFVGLLADCEPSAVGFGAAAFNWRGALSKTSSQFLSVLGIGIDSQELMSIRLLEMGLKIYLGFQHSTFRTSRSVGPRNTSRARVC